MRQLGFNIMSGLVVLDRSFIIFVSKFFVTLWNVYHGTE